MKNLRMKMALLVLPTLFSALMVSVETANASVTCLPTSVAARTPTNIPAPARTLITFPSVISLKTNCGDIDIELVPNAAPITTTHILALARGGYYDRTLCHRLTTSGIFVIQCGDPMASGMGGPGWTFADENLPRSTTNNYPAGTVAMANAGPATNGSQFFITYQDSTIAPNYSIWGRVISGLEILKFIASKGVVGGSAVDGAPALTFAIDSIEEGDQYALRMFNKGVAQSSSNLTSLQGELEKSKSALSNLTQQNKGLQTKLTRICKAKPKPKGC